jgi:crossover junction endodeoxyribonuclease RuvC
MPKKKQRILAIDPGTVYMGIALLEGEKLVHHGVKTIPNQASPHERLRRARQIVLSLFQDFRPQMLALEKTFFARNRNVSLLNVLTDEIRAIARRRRVKICGFAPSTVKKWICGNGRASKEQVARTVAARYPELAVYLTQDRKWKARFHHNMFDAVALAMLAAKRQQADPRVSRRFQSKPLSGKLDSKQRRHR